MLLFHYYSYIISITVLLNFLLIIYSMAIVSFFFIFSIIIDCSDFAVEIVQMIKELLDSRIRPAIQEVCNSYDSKTL
jgi:hypothetical protein